MSDTPRTDMARIPGSWRSDGKGGVTRVDVSGCVFIDFARGLERELNAALARIKELENAEKERAEKDWQAKSRRCWNCHLFEPCIANRKEGWCQWEEKETKPHYGCGDWLERSEKENV